MTGSPRDDARGRLVGTARGIVSEFDSVRVAVAGIVVLALAARLFALGARVAHQDEARVAYWAYRYAESGVYWYRPIVHGPFLTVVNSYVFQTLGASDFTMRLVPALVGGLLPASALLFRGRLRDSETVALAALLGANPLLLYFSRFYRNDLLLAGFMLVAVGFFVRAYDHRRPAALYAGTAAFALAVTTKENALVYPVCWAGAAALLWDRRLLAESADASGLSAATDRVRATARGVWRWRAPFALAVAEFFAVVVFFYAPRGASAGASPTLGRTLRDPTLFPALVGEATLGSWHAFTGKWVGGSDHSYLWTAKSLWPALADGGAVVLAFAALGFLADRYSGSPRDVVGFAFFWGASSLAGYPVIVDNPFPWEVVHVVVPLAIPAAVGLALVARLGAASLADGDGISATAAAVVLLVVTAQVGGTAVATSYLHPQSDDNEFVQYAQSGSEMKSLLGEIQRISKSNEGIDVLYYGSAFYVADEEDLRAPPGEGGWFDRLPLAWYLEAAGATTDSTTRPEIVGEDPPPVVVSLGTVETCDESYDRASDIDRHLRDYERHEVHRFLQDSGCHKSSLVVYVDENASEESVEL